MLCYCFIVRCYLQLYCCFICLFKFCYQFPKYTIQGGGLKKLRIVCRGKVSWNIWSDFECVPRWRRPQAVPHARAAARRAGGVQLRGVRLPAGGLPPRRRHRLPDAQVPVLRVWLWSHILSQSHQEGKELVTLQLCLWIKLMSHQHTLIAIKIN